MPYSVLKKGRGYKVCLTKNPSKCFSKKPLSKQRAMAQSKAIRANTHESFDLTYRRIIESLNSDS
jgi:hypothetical protein